MKKLRYFTIFLILIITIHPVFIYGNNYLRFKYSIDSSRLSYRNSYIAYGLHYSFNKKLALNINLKKLPDENGYYPVGYFASSNWGIYERGSYSIVLKKLAEFNKIIIGNYMPHFGQGILFGSAYPLYIYNPYYDLGIFRDGIAAAKTYSKSSILEGLAAEYGYGKLKIRPFLSWNSYDCSAGGSDYYKYDDNDYDGIPNDEDDNDFTGKKDGFPDNYSCKYSLEKAVNDETIYSNAEYDGRRNKLTEYMIGVNSSIKYERCTGGFTLLYSRFNRMVDPYYNFDPDSGDKSAFYFRGKDYTAGEVYFKYDGRIQYFADVAGSYYKSLSYYDEFYGSRIVGFGFSSGIRSRIEKVSLLFWASYIPGTLVNPHGTEFPWGRKNFASAVMSMGFSYNKINFTHWIEASKELFDIDNPGSGEEVDLSYNYNFFYNIFENIGLEIRQRYEAVENWYYYPGSRSYKIATKMNIKHKLSKYMRMTDIIEYRIGQVESSSILRGIGVGARITVNKNDNQYKGMIFGYTTEDHVFTALYPYEPSVYRWSFFPSSLSGRGVLISASFTRDINDFFTAGFKIRLNADAVELNKSSLKFYINTEMRF